MDSPAKTIRTQIHKLRRTRPKEIRSQPKKYSSNPHNKKKERKINK
jgi:hypothetical protein